MKRPKLTYLIQWFLLCSFFCWSGVCQLFGQSFISKTYTQTDGLPSSLVHDIAQDLTGRIWAGTRTGLSSFDGDEWTTLPANQGLGPVRVRQVEVDGQGNLWLASQNNGQILATQENGLWRLINRPPEWTELDNPFDVGLSVASTSNGPMVGLSRQGWLVFYGGGMWFPFNPNQRSELGRIRHHRAMGNAFLVSAEKGLFVIQPYLEDKSISTDARYNQVIPEQERDLLAAIAVGTDPNPKVIWVVGTRWISIIEDGKYRHFVETPEPLADMENGQLTVYVDEEGNLLVGNGLHLYQAQRQSRSLVRLGGVNGLVGEGATSIISDRENGLWVSSMRGLTRIHSRCFSNTQKNQGLLEDEITSILEWKPDKLLLGHPNGFTLSDGQQWRRIPLPPRTGVGIQRIMEMTTYKDKVLAPVLGVGVVQLNQQLQLSYLPSDPGIESAYSVLVKGDDIWVAASKHVFKWEDGRFRILADAPAMQGNRVQALSDGKIVFSSQDSGVWFYDGNWSNVRAKSANVNGVFTVVETRYGLLAGTLSGIFEIRGKQMVPFGMAGDLSNAVYFIFEDSKHRLWVGTDIGIFRLETGKKRHYAAPDGLPELEMNRDAFLEDSAGNFWFGSAGGLSKYHEAFDFAIQPPTITLEKIYSQNKVWGIATEMVLPAQENDLTFNYNAISMYRNSDIWVSGFLEGLDSSWLPKQRASANSMVYRNVPPGQYRFHLRAIGPGSQWSVPLVSAPITITRPYWQNGWFLILVTILGVGLVYLILDYFTSKRFSHYLQLQVDERTSELVNKNQMLEDRIQDHIRAKAEIKALNDELEERVLKRTAELERLQKDKVENAHYAGMAEIATSVLHNVGNILNSLSTSAFLIQETLDHTKLRALFKANHLLSQHLDDFETFYRDDPKGPDLLRFYLSIGGKLETEHSTLNVNLRLLQDKLEAIKDVVSHQNNYTSGVYQTEPMNPNEMVETAIKILEASFENHHIQLELSLNPVPNVYIQKTKMIHTLVNLLKNGSESIRANPQSDRIIRVESQADEAHVYLRVLDSGTGIPHENLEKIFNHGFTTKEDGHGFGLHSCANAMQEMKGSMWAENRPEGGACFVLKFPIPTEPRPDKPDPSETADPTKEEV